VRHKETASGRNKRGFLVLDKQREAAREKEIIIDLRNATLWTAEASVRTMGLELALGLTTSLFRLAVYQRETKGLKVYNPLNKFAITPAASSKLESSGFLAR